MVDQTPATDITMCNSDEKLFRQLEKLQTEQRNPETKHIDLANSLEIVRLMNAQDEKVSAAVARKEQEIAKAVDLVAAAFAAGGRLIYAGAGTSGRLGVLDAAECPPTFGSDPQQVIGLIAGGKEAMFRAQEGAEDNPAYGAADISELHVTPIDVVCGLAASGRTPYVHGALAKAKELGSKTVFVCCLPESQVDLSPPPDVTIAVEVGPEVIMGSTRLKSGTAQKMVCNMISTGAFIRRGKVYENVMVDLQLTNKKLMERARRIIMMLTGCGYEEAGRLLKVSGNSVKTAILMQLTDTEKSKAEQLLQEHNGFLRAVLTSVSR